MPKPASCKSKTFINEQIKQAISELTSDLLEKILLEAAIKHPEVAADVQTNLVAMKATMKAANLAIPPLDFNPFATRVQDTFEIYQNMFDESLDWDSESQNSSKGSTLKYDLANDIRDSILITVEGDIVGKVEQDLCYETKHNALNALADIGWEVVNFDQGYLSCASQSIEVPDSLIHGMWTITHMMKPDEIQHVAEETDEPTRRFASTRTMEMTMEREKGKTDLMEIEPQMICQVKDNPMTAIHHEVLSLNADNSFIVKILRLRWADNLHKEHRVSWVGLDDVVDFFMSGLNAVSEPVAA